MPPPAAAAPDPAMPRVSSQQRRGALQSIATSNAEAAHVEDDTPRSHYAPGAGPGTFRRTTAGDSSNGMHNGSTAGGNLTLWQELPNMALLVVLYMMQGVPLGLTMGSMPLLLASKASFTQARALKSSLGLCRCGACLMRMCTLVQALADAYFPLRRGSTAHCFALCIACVAPLHRMRCIDRHVFSVATYPTCRRIALCAADRHLQHRLVPLLLQAALVARR
jgi:Acetyl-coenzyme A transporter 1